MKQMHEIIKECKDVGIWQYLVASSDWAFEKDKQYTIYKLAETLEPLRKYGYRKRLAAYIAENQPLTGGVLPYCRN